MKKLRVGIMMVGDAGWAGGLYYSLNIVKLLKSHLNTGNCSVTVFCNASIPIEITRELQSLDVEIVNIDQHSFLYKAFGYLYRKISGRNIRVINAINRRKIEVLFPLTTYSAEVQFYKAKCIFWIYDFQHKFLPQLFTKEEIVKRDKEFSEISDNALDLVFSSDDSRSHFTRFYPNSKAQLHVFKFASLINKSHIENVDSAVYPIKGQFFIVSNQFWKHKNHIVVLKALNVLKEKNINCTIVFTGNTKSYSNENYFLDLEKYIQEMNLIQHVVFTGFLPRNDQLALMNNALAVIQPSFFEGWSTVIEDAKALNKYVLASSIPINKEQLESNASFFDPNDHDQLADHIISVLNGNLNVKSFDYTFNERSAFDSIIDILYSTK